MDNNTINISDDSGSDETYCPPYEDKKHLRVSQPPHFHTRGRKYDQESHSQTQAHNDQQSHTHTVRHKLKMNNSHPVRHKLKIINNQTVRHSMKHKEHQVKIKIKMKIKIYIQILPH